MATTSHRPSRNLAAGGFRARPACAACGPLPRLLALLVLMLAIASVAAALARHRGLPVAIDANGMPAAMR